MALSPRYRAVDNDLYFSDAQALTVTTAAYSESQIDLGVVDMGAGSPIDVVCYISGITATAASTILVEVADGAATAPTTIIQDIGTVVTGSAAFEKLFTLPKEVKRYVRLRYTLSGSAASSCLITAFATARPT